MKVKPGDALRDLQATVDELAKLARSAWSATATVARWRGAAASRLERVAAASAITAGMICAKRQPAQGAGDPTLRRTDAMIPPSEIDAVRAPSADVPIYNVSAGHGFNCDQRASYHEDPRAWPNTRTLELFGKLL